MMKKRGKIVIALLAFGMAILLTIYGPQTKKGNLQVNLNNRVKVESVVQQKITGIKVIPEYVYSIYYKDQLIGVLNDITKIDQTLNDVYLERYAEEFPDSSLSFNEDIFIAKELTFMSYQDIDDALLAYLSKNDYFAIKVPKITLSNGYVFYVKSLDDFNIAQDKYVLNFISQEGYTNIQNQIQTPELTEYGTRETKISIQEKIEVTEGYASYDKIKKNVDEIIYFLSYGDDTEMKYHTVGKYDTVEGIAYKYGLEPQHIVMINSDQLHTTQDILTEGQVLNVTYYNSPLTIVVTKERLYAEKVYPPSTKYIYDSSLAEGLRRTVQNEKEGSADILMQEIYINGVLQEEQSVKLSSTITVAPIQEILRVGTKVIPGVGTGSFRWPVDNPQITCRWYCYAGHKALDMINRYKSAGNIYAADRGVVIANSYDYISGYYVKINHNNGYVTHYGHMRNKSSVYVGQKVDKGQYIGTIGSTGRASGPHVHFAVEKNGVRINPCVVLKC